MKRTPVWYHSCIGAATSGEPVPLPITKLICPDCGTKKVG